MPANTALVTGASGGLGFEFAKLLARDGYNLALVARSAQKLEENARSLRSQFGVKAEAIALDLALPDAAKRVFERIPSCDVLVNNAGFANNGAFARMNESEILEEIQLDVVTLTHLTRLYLPGMLERGHGRVLNVASTAGFLPGPNMAVYYASKAYVLSFSEAIAHEVRGSGVTVSCLAPGATATGFQERANMRSTILFRLPLADAATVAKAGYEGMKRGKPVVVPGLMNKLVALSPKITPRRLLVAISGAAVKRG